MNEEIKNEIQKLKKEKDAVILAHYYVDGEVQEIADYVGDSYYLAEIATKVPESTIVFCGVSFMGESAKILNPKKRVIMADGHADCPMAHMVDVDKIREVRNEYPDVSVVCYVNSTAEIKAESDVCVTSSNALKIVKNLPNKDSSLSRMRILVVTWQVSFRRSTSSLMMDSAMYIRVSTKKNFRSQRGASGSTRTDTSGMYRRIFWNYLILSEVLRRLSDYATKSEK